MISGGDEELDVYLQRYGRAFSKAALIGLMATISIWIFTESAWKALLFGFAFFVISLFRTWSRFLEPIGLLVFIAAVVYACDQNVLSHVRMAFAR
jgi:hypothetical protein